MTRSAPRRPPRVPLDSPDRDQLRALALGFQAAGYTVAEIGVALRYKERNVQNLLSEGRRLGTIPRLPDELQEESVPKFEDLSSDLQRSLEWSPDGFERFFNTYSPFKMAPHTRVFVEMWFTGTDRMVLNVPPRHAKSIVFSSWLPIWLITRDRNVQILSVGQSEQLALKFCRVAGVAMEYNERLISDFGRYKPSGDQAGLWRPQSGQFIVAGRTRGEESGDMTLLARGAGQVILGLEADYLIADDVCDPRTMRSEDNREALEEWFRGEALSRLNPDGTALVIGQRVHLDDLYARLLKDFEEDDPEKPYWNHITFPAVKDWETGDVLWPDMWDIKRLRKKRKDLGTAKFQCFYQQDPASAGDVLARPEWIYGPVGNPDSPFRGCLDTERFLGVGEPRGEDRVVRVCSVDPSPRRYWGITVADVPYRRQGFRTTVLDVVKGQFTGPEGLEEIRKLWRAYGFRYLIFEVNAAQRWLMQDPDFRAWRQGAQVRLIEHTTTVKKLDPEWGIDNMAPLFEDGMVRLPWGDEDAKAASRLLIEEATTYPHGTTDDVLMSLWFIRANHPKLLPEDMGARGPAADPRIPEGLRGGFPWLRRFATTRTGFDTRQPARTR